MKVIIVMFDSLNRRFLEPYGSQETITPNFTRLARHTVQFENCYAGSLPCIPARRELHTGRYNFLHRSWGPLEPFDDSVFRILRENGIHSHLVSDHGHYWECGGATYHTQYSSWENIRGEEGDAWAPTVKKIEDKDPNFAAFSEGLRGELYLQNLANRARINGMEDYPLVQTFDAGMKFLEENYREESWILQVESFSPHEPFMASEKYKKMYSCREFGKKYEWPDYAPVKEDADDVEEVRKAYFADLTMCDEQLGRILDFMDRHELWKDTMLIVNTDHGYMLGEHGYWAKNYMPCYDEVVHTPLFIWDPRTPQSRNIKRNALVQTIDLPVTILAYFGISPTESMQGKDLSGVICLDQPVREHAFFGVFGAHICCTDGRYVYMRAPRNRKESLYEYTLLPTHMMDFFSTEELRTMRYHDPFDFTKGIGLMQIKTSSGIRCIDQGDFLFDLKEDPHEKINLQDEKIKSTLTSAIRKVMQETDSPDELYRRFEV